MYECFLSWITLYNKYLQSQRDWFMGERKEVLEEQYVLWVEAQILQSGLQGNQEASSVGSDPGVSADTNSLDTSNISNSVASLEGQPGSIPVDERTGEPPLEGVWSNDEVVHVVESAEEGSFDPQQFWLMLAQIGYEDW